MEKMQDTVRGQEEFTAAFAHELKTPLTSIIGYADTIRQMELSREETDMCAGYIYSQGKRLQSLSYKLLELSMADRKEIGQENIYVPDLMRDLERTGHEGEEDYAAGAGGGRLYLRRQRSSDVTFPEFAG